MSREEGKEKAGLPDDLLRRVYVTGKSHHPEIISVTRTICGWLKERGREVVVDGKIDFEGGRPAASLNEEAPGLSLVIVLGGDGTLLGAARRLIGHRMPLLGVNLGVLGFLAEASSGEIVEVLEDIDARRYRIEERMMLGCRIIRRGELVGEYVALNDVVINKGSTARIIDLEVRVDDSYLTRIRADGLIVSTPTGSTAYSMSAGGPIVYPMMEAILLTPICPHILANRPIVIPRESKVTVNLMSGTADVLLTLDGQEAVPLEIGDQAEIFRSQQSTSLVHSLRFNYYGILRKKLKWGEW